MCWSSSSCQVCVALAFGFEFVYFFFILLLARWNASGIGIVEESVICHGLSMPSGARPSAWCADHIAPLEVSETDDGSTADIFAHCNTRRQSPRDDVCSQSHAGIERPRRHRLHICMACPD